MTDAESKLRTLRREHHTPIEILADIAGVSERTIIRYETGETQPTVSAARRLARYYKLLIDDLFPDEDLPQI